MKLLRKKIILPGCCVLLALMFLTVVAVVSGCSLFTPLPPPVTTRDRLAVVPRADVPVSRPVVIHWNRYQVPFIDARTDEDAAFALGVVHAHLRLAQMELLRRAAQGRLAEMFGPPAVDIDHSLRILDLPRAAEASLSVMPDETREWLRHYARGINFYADRLEELPVEFEVLGMQREPWTLEDVVLVGRLASVDVNWISLIMFLRARNNPYFDEFWDRYREIGTSSAPSFDPEDGESVLREIIGGWSKSGSNSIVVAPERSRSGAAIMANDPHLGITIPNTWLIAGVHCPSYHAVGLMLPGLPFVAVGRNMHIAWGGTNMRAASSDLYDIRDVPADEIRSETQTIRVRWWFDEKVTVRRSPLGPVISDLPFLKEYSGPPAALRWVGHQPSDEFTALLRMNKATTPQEFKQAFATYAVSGQNFIYADRAGNIGQFLAVRLPVRSYDKPPAPVLDPDDPEHTWNGYRNILELPNILNPEQGFLVSCNNKPAESTTPFGFFFPLDDRFRRITQILSRDGQVGFEDLAVIQRDVYGISPVAIRDLMLRRMEDHNVEAPGEFLERLSTWDGHFREDSAGAVAFQLLLGHFARLYYRKRYGEDAAEFPLRSSFLMGLIREDLNSEDQTHVKAALEEAVKRAARDAEEFATWGDMHRLPVAHLLARLPLVGNRYQFMEFPVGGSSQTVMKTAHGPEPGLSRTRYGSNARHISDLADPDENHFVLLGGQDGWINSGNFLDQVVLWRQGRYMKIPLRVETIRRQWTTRTVLEPPVEQEQAQP